MLMLILSMREKITVTQNYCERKIMTKNNLDKNIQEVFVP